MECFGVPGLSLLWSIQSQKSRVLVSFLWVLSKVLTSGRSRYVGEKSGCWKSHIRNVHSLVTLWAVI